MKLRHLILFIVACALLIGGRLPGGPLLALLAWLQINILLTQSNFSKASQTWGLMLFLVTIPLVLIWGACHSFLWIYFNEQSWFLFMMSISITFCLCVLASIYFILAFETAATNGYKILKSLTAAFNEIPIKKPLLFKSSGLLFLFSLIPILSSDWKIVFAIMATHLYLSRQRLMQVFASGL